MNKTTAFQRSLIMKSVGQKNTKPEIKTRQALHRLGLRFRLHDKKLPGTPDIVLSKHRTVIFIHGCFWHRHTNCRYATTPKTRKEYWLPKFSKNIERDANKTALLEEQGWRVLIVWECETKNIESLNTRLKHDFDLLGPGDESLHTY